MPEMVVETLEEYEALAVRLALSPPELARLRAKLVPLSLSLSLSLSPFPSLSLSLSLTLYLSICLPPSLILQPSFSPLPLLPPSFCPLSPPPPIPSISIPPSLFVCPHLFLLVTHSHSLAHSLSGGKAARGPALRCRALDAKVRRCGYIYKVWL
jgi:hypothetical protein